MTASEQTYRAGTFRFGDGGQVVEGITDGTTWNGAANVYVTRETLQDLTEDIETCLWQNGMNATVTVSDDGSDARIAYDDMDEADDVLPVVVHDGTTFYGLINGWTWIDMGNRLTLCPTCEDTTWDVRGPLTCKMCGGWGFVDVEDAE